MNMQRFGNQQRADANEEGQGDDFERRITVDEVTDDGGEEQHHEHGDGNGGNHDEQVAAEADGGEDGIERKDNVNKSDLNDGLCNSKDEGSFL